MIRNKLMFGIHACKMTQMIIEFSKYLLLISLLLDKWINWLISSAALWMLRFCSVNLDCDSVRGMIVDLCASVCPHQGNRKLPWAHSKRVVNDVTNPKSRMWDYEITSLYFVSVRPHLITCSEVNLYRCLFRSTLWNEGRNYFWMIQRSSQWGNKPLSTLAGIWESY